MQLIPNGRSTAVAFEDRERYCQLALNYRLHEVTLQVAAMREGFCRSGPGLLLPILTWRELERRICGRPEIDVKLLKKKTRYNMPGGEKNKVGREGNYTCCKQKEQQFITIWEQSRVL